MNKTFEGCEPLVLEVEQVGDAYTAKCPRCGTRITDYTSAARNIWYTRRALAAKFPSCWTICCGGCHGHIVLPRELQGE